MTPKALLNATNLHVGGGLQVAVSVVTEILRAADPDLPVSLALSSEIAEMVGKGPGNGLYVLDAFGLKGGGRRARALLDRHDTVFTLFGPLYRWRPPFRSIVGFAQPWIIYPRNEVYTLLPRAARLKTRLKFWIQAQFFKRSDALVVELDHVKAGLISELGIDPARIHVIHNCVSALYGDEGLWEPLAMPATEGVLRLGFLGRNYRHKNTAIFPAIVSALRRRHGREAKVFVTFTAEEWRACGPEFRAACINVGPLTAAQCPAFYRGLDAVVFPSLLECFSATPLEAMAMGRPLFASDRSFNRDICGPHARYFDPLAPEQAADQIASLFAAGGPDPAALTAARRHAFAFASPATRAEKYLALLGRGESMTDKSRRLT